MVVCLSRLGLRASPRVIPKHFQGFRHLLRAKRARGRGNFALSYGRKRSLLDPHTLLVLTKISISPADPGTDPETHAQYPPSPPLSFSCQALEGGTKKAAECLVCRLMSTHVCMHACLVVLLPIQVCGVQVHVY